MTDFSWGKPGSSSSFFNTKTASEGLRRRKKKGGGGEISLHVRLKTKNLAYSLFPERRLPGERVSEPPRCLGDTSHVPHVASDLSNPGTAGGKQKASRQIGEQMELATPGRCVQLECVMHTFPTSVCRVTLMGV